VRSKLDWLEEPFPIYDEKSYHAYQSLPDAPPLAMGESNYGLESYRQLIASCNPRVVQPDLTKTSGISEGREIAKLVIGQGRRLCLHILAGPVGLMASANFMAAMDGTDILEMDVRPMAFYAAVLGGKPVVKDGWLELSRRPGLGIDLDEAACKEWIVG
jgi:D-galactarolactone cycloisomerase